MPKIDESVLQGLNLSAKPASKKSDAIGQEGFLKLMTTQLNHQDPLKPMENGEFFSQIAQFSSVAGIQELQSTFKDVASALYSNQALQASSMVGRSVSVQSDTLQHTGNTEHIGSIDLPASSQAVKIGIFDSAGQLVRQLDLGSNRAGPISFKWDGLTDAGVPANKGIYNVRAEADLGGDNISLPTQISALVDSVSLGQSGSGIKLNLGSLGEVNFSDVKQIR